jgi:hypothetical protein
MRTQVTESWLSQLTENFPISAVRDGSTLHVLTDDKRAAVVAWESKPENADIQVHLRLKRDDGSIIPFSSHRDSGLGSWYGLG